MKTVLTNIWESPYCQYCIFSEDCTWDMKYEARRETDPEELKVWDVPCCYQD